MFNISYVCRSVETQYITKFRVMEVSSRPRSERAKTSETIGQLRCSGRAYGVSVKGNIMKNSI